MTQTAALTARWCLFGPRRAFIRARSRLSFFNPPSLNSQHGASRRRRCAYSKYLLHVIDIRLIDPVFDPDQDPEEKRELRQNYRALTRQIKGARRERSRKAITEPPLQTSRRISTSIQQKMCWIRCTGQTGSSIMVRFPLRSMRLAVQVFPSQTASGSNIGLAFSPARVQCRRG